MYWEIVSHARNTENFNNQQLPSTEYGKYKVRLPVTNSRIRRLLILNSERYNIGALFSSTRMQSTVQSGLRPEVQ